MVILCFAERQKLHDIPKKEQLIQSLHIDVKITRVDARLHSLPFEYISMLIEDEAGCLAQNSVPWSKI